jgi:hypothetical protein
VRELVTKSIDNMHTTRSEFKPLHENNIIMMAQKEREEEDEIGDMFFHPQEEGFSVGIV